MRRIQGDFDRRNTQAVTRGLAFNAAHDRARDDFFMELVSSARNITGIPAPSAPADINAHRGFDLSPTAEAALRRQVAAQGITATLASGAGAAAADDEADHESAYSAVVAAAMLTPVPSETTHPDPRAGATARATRALLGGGTDPRRRDRHRRRDGAARRIRRLGSVTPHRRRHARLAGPPQPPTERPAADRAGSGRGEPRRHPARLRRRHGHPGPRDRTLGLHRGSRQPRASPVAGAAPRQPRSTGPTSATTSSASTAPSSRWPPARYAWTAST